MWPFKKKEYKQLSANFVKQIFSNGEFVKPVLDGNLWWLTFSDGRQMVCIDEEECETKCEWINASYRHHSTKEKNDAG